MSSTLSSSTCAHCRETFYAHQASRLCGRCFVAGHRGVRCGEYCKPSIEGETAASRLYGPRQPQTERIEFSAIKSADGRIFGGRRHADIIATMVMDYETSPHYGVQGFLTNRLRFVDRKEAAEIALSSGQVRELRFQPSELFSEDLW